MLLLVALAAASGLVIFLPSLMIVRVLLNWPVVGFLLVFLALLTAPLLYAWSTRPFRG